MSRIGCVVLLVGLVLLSGCSKDPTGPSKIEYPEGWPDYWNANLPEASTLYVRFLQEVTPGSEESDTLLTVALDRSVHTVSLDNAVRFQMPPEITGPLHSFRTGNFEGVPGDMLLYTRSRVVVRITEPQCYQYDLTIGELRPAHHTMMLIDERGLGILTVPEPMYAFVLDTDTDNSGQVTLHMERLENQIPIDTLSVTVDAAENTVLMDRALWVDDIPGLRWNDYGCRWRAEFYVDPGFCLPRGLGMLAWVPGKEADLGLYRGGYIIVSSGLPDDIEHSYQEGDVIYLALCELPDCFGGPPVMDPEKVAEWSEAYEEMR